MLYDAREGHSRLLNLTDGMNHGGLFGYVALDMENFRRWVAGIIGATGNQALNNNGYIIYFSDRRGDHNENLADAPETGDTASKTRSTRRRWPGRKPTCSRPARTSTRTERSRPTARRRTRWRCRRWPLIPIMGFDGARGRGCPLGPRQHWRRSTRRAAGWRARSCSGAR